VLKSLLQPHKLQDGFEMNGSFHQNQMHDYMNASFSTPLCILLSPCLIPSPAEHLAKVSAHFSALQQRHSALLFAHYIETSHDIITCLVALGKENLGSTKGVAT